jgi:acetyl esterase/lipase
VAVVIHGGFWRARYGRKLMRPLCRDLARRGWAAWNIEYRRLGRVSGGGWPATFGDVAYAIDHLAEIRTDAPLDLARVVSIGHSAGGHLAAWAAARRRLPEGAPGAHPRVPVTAAVSQAGVVDLRLAYELRLSGGVVGELLGGGPERHRTRYALASPAELVPLGVPVLLTHGGRDEIVPPAVSEAFAAAARSAGDEVELVLLEDEDHFGHLDPANPLWAAVVEWLA